jgi:general secretion pathway protein H
LLHLNRSKLKHHSQNGFTLIEVVVVLAMVGLILATVRYTVFTGSIKNEIEKEALRLQVVFSMASDFAVINQIELGLRIDEEEQTYEFVMLDDDDKWVSIDTHKHFSQFTFSEGVFVELILEGLEWQNDESLFDNRVFDEQLSVSNEGVQIGNEEDIPPPPPQIFILSSGEITPFELLVRYEPQGIGDEEFEFSLQGKETVPIELTSAE